LRLADGSTAKLAGMTRRPSDKPVYNLEIHGQHVYHVGLVGTLVHNSYVTRVVDIRKLQYPSSRPFADAKKLRAHGSFDINKYTPAKVRLKKNGVMVIENGVTRIENAIRHGIFELPVIIGR